MPEIELTIFTVSAKGKLDNRVNLTEITKLIKGAVFNERFKGGRVEIKILDGEEEIGTILLSASGSFILSCKDPEYLLPAYNLFLNRIKRVADKRKQLKENTEKLASS